MEVYAGLVLCLRFRKEETMYKGSGIGVKIIAVICISIFTLASVPPAADASAGERDRGRAGFSREYGRHDRHEARYQRSERTHERREFRAPRHERWRERRHVISPPRVRHRHIVRSLPWGYTRYWYGRRPYYYSRGLFYEPYLGGFLAVRPPLGAVIISLPIGYERVWIDGTAYYTYGGTYYRRVPAGYAVVEPPARVIVENAATEVVPPDMPASGQVIVDAPVLNVRSGPSIDEKMIFQFEEGAVLEVTGKSDGWLYVQLPNGQYGWVKSVFTKPADPGSG